jgi:Ni/Fe-hydrogenase 1 B-type cytochrome subunit
MSDTPQQRYDYTEVINPEGVKQTAVYVYEAPVRIWHWITVIAIVVLCVTGYLIGQPLPSFSGEASDHFAMGYIRFVHFAAGLILAATFFGRIYWAFVGNHHARQIFVLPVWSGAWWKEVLYEIRWYLFLAREPKMYLGHNPLAQMTMFFAFVLPTALMIFTGLALYAEGLGMDHWMYTITEWALAVFGSSIFIHTVHRIGMWVIILFSMTHIYVAFREDIMSRQSIISTMVSGWRMFKDGGK